MAPERTVRVQKRVVRGADGRKRLVVVAKRSEHGPGTVNVEMDMQTFDIDELREGDTIMEEEEDGHTVFTIKIPRVEREDGSSDALVRAAGVSGAIEDLEGEVAALVRRAREQGYSWTQIGSALGITKQAAWERFSGEE